MNVIVKERTITELTDPQWMIDVFPRLKEGMEEVQRRRDLEQEASIITRHGRQSVRSKDSKWRLKASFTPQAFFINLWAQPEIFYDGKKMDAYLRHRPEYDVRPK